VSRYAKEVLANLKVAYQQEVTLAEGKGGKALPPAGDTLRKFRDVIASMTGGV
jgi:hypothetical protein